MILPKGWQYLSLKDFCKTGSGSTPSRKELSKYYNGNIPWVKSGELKESIIFETEEYITEIALKETSVKLIPSGALLVAMYGATVGRVAILGIEATSNQEVCSIIPDELIADKRYLFYALRQQVPKWLNLRVGGAQPNISQQIIKDTKIPHPPLNEQIRIAQILDKADEIRQKRKQAIILTEELLKSTFLEMFGDHKLNQWELTTIENIISNQKNSIRTGPFGSQLLHSEFVEQGIAVLGIDNAVNNYFTWGQKRFITEEKYKQLKRYTVKAKDVIITIMGTCGRCAIIPENICLSINTKHLCCITLNYEKCLPEFLHSYFLIHPQSKHYLSKHTKGAIMDGLNMTIIKKMPIPLVPINLQKQYKNIYSHLNFILEKNKTFLQESENLFNSLLQKAFKGEL